MPPGSSLYQELTPAELDRILRAALGEPARHTRLLTGGLFNTTYLVETAAGKAVLRVGPVNHHLLMPFEHHLMQAEARVYELCAAHGVPASAVIAVDTSKTLIDRDFMLVRHIPSRAMSEAALTPQEREHVCRAVGEATAKMHRITAPRFGRINAVASGGGFRRWSSFLRSELDDWTTVGAQAGLLTAGELAHIRRLFFLAAPCLDEITQPCLVHTDLWEGNVLVEAGEFAAIIDADRALWGDPMFEFSSIQWTYREPAFWEGYGCALPQERGDLIRRSVYTLLNRLWNAYVYQCEYNQPENAQGERADALRQAALLSQWLDA